MFLMKTYSMWLPLRFTVSDTDILQNLKVTVQFYSDLDTFDGNYIKHIGLGCHQGYDAVV